MYTVKHSTVVFADIQGSSAIMQRDEIEGLASLHRFKHVITKNLESCNGQLLHIWGDGCLVIFDSADDALRFSIKAQLEFVNNSWPMMVRFGLNCGDVHIAENNAYGHVVNLASHLESIGKPGAVLLTECVRSSLSSSMQNDLRPLGTFKFNKVNESYEVYAVMREGLVVPESSDYKQYLSNGKYNGNSFRRFTSAIMSMLPSFLSNGTALLLLSI